LVKLWHSFSIGILGIFFAKKSFAKKIFGSNLYLSAKKISGLPPAYRQAGKHNGWR
jgi:hypothetical protein